ncbi:vancomycin resistance histidine kinase VanS [Bacillus pseudomycoides]|uniref:HAMP domain-containing sensor histidine kinase n=1 Tax=Bacillus pseudomycoides TaxID=64104 RepID=UPI000BECEFAA|nr:HAMP domain-containing sensor histidine kinase [Bacillus pseudomycoides]PDY46432.1 vancomycin resistance histidine kinase VanS [Bacillus pseudomycoides]PED69081.1 vancomycin resistance histidine kinase VanS [Bacillus pseudomycoides]PEI43965.1 vancomycin resistance histidine kinase VanS [Bacillus pseudomycoides]PEJ69941.1 vancomycin resistance histidine kinase VanS [Bacillus pseudomycoides]PEM08565.1 vancomycin resistance histidine kinase VanS [Bacillus pseudomycoides]
MAKMMRSFRFKMITLFALSMVLAAGGTYMIYKGLLYYKTMVLHKDPLEQFRSTGRAFEDMNFFLISFILLSILFFFFLTKPYLKYFDEISNGIHYLANGDFTNKVQISSNDEFRDIAREINIASEKLKEAVERGDFAENSKDQLVVNLAHDLRTPLTSVLVYLDLILKEENLTKEQIKHFSTIAFMKSQQLESLIDELFEITRMNYGMLKLDEKTINISELLIQLDEELYPLLEKQHLEARLNVDPHLYINGDGKLLARVFENLLTNAIRYGDNGQFVDMNGYIDNGEVIVQIINYGDSIPEEDLPYLFDMLYTGDKARTEQQGGTGLGLCIAKNIVEQHNGTISAESNVIRTIFEVRLPKEESSKI